MELHQALVRAAGMAISATHSNGVAAPPPPSSPIDARAVASDEELQRLFAEANRFRDNIAANGNACARMRASLAQLELAMQEDARKSDEALAAITARLLRLGVSRTDEEQFAENGKRKK